MKLNINDTVKVKLTPYGLELYRKYWLPYCKFGCTPTKQDINGYTEFQLWDLMNIFGSSLYLGCKLPFDTTIEIPEEMLS